MSHAKAAGLLALLALAACSKDAPHNDPNGGVVRLEVAPNALLLAHPGEQQTLSVIAYNEAGQEIEPEGIITWTSTHPTIVAVSDIGEVVAAEGVGSSQIIARVGTIESTPITVAVVQAVPGAVMVNDAQIDGPLRPTGGRNFDVTLRDVGGLAVGAIVLSRESIPLAGRVTAVADAGGGSSNVSLTAVNLNEAFTALKIDESYKVPSAPLATTAKAGRARGEHHLRQAEAEFDYGPFECEASAAPQVELSLPLKLELEPTIDIDWVLDLQNGTLTHMRAVAKGGLTISPSGVFETTAAFTAELTCELELIKFVIPVGGALSFFVAPAVPMGVGFTVEGELQVAKLRLGYEGKLGAIVTAGVDYTDQAGLTLVRDFQPIAEFEPVFEVPGSISEGLRLKLASQIFAFAKVAVQTFPALPGSPTLEILEITGGPEVELDYKNESGQATDTAYNSEYNAKLKASAGLAGDITDALEILGGAVAFTPPEVEVELQLAASPSGTLSASATTVESGVPVTFTVNISSGDTFLTVHNIDQVSVLELKNDGSLRQISAVPGVIGKTSYQMQWTPTEAEAGNHVFVAFVRPSLLGVDALPRLEVDANSQVSINVHIPGVEPPAAVAGIYTFLYSPTPDCAAAYDEGFWLFPNGAVGGSASNWGWCYNSAEQQFKVPFGTWTADPDGLGLSIDFCAWTSPAAPDHSVHLTWNPTTTRWEGDYSEYQAGWTACLVQVQVGHGSGVCVAGSTCQEITTATCNGDAIPPYTLICLGSGQDCCYEECPTGGYAPWMDQLEVTCFD